MPGTSIAWPPRRLAGDRVAQLSRQPLQHRGLQQERAHLRGPWPSRTLVGQVVQHEAVAAADRRHAPGRIRVPPQRQPGQLQPRRPPLGAGHQRCHRRAGQARPRRLAEQLRRLLGGETQIRGAQLSQLAAGPQPRQRQRRVGPAGHHHPQARRQILQQERHRLMHRPGIDQVVVIQDQDHLIRAGIGSHLVDQGRHQPLSRTRGQRADPPGQPWAGPVQRGHRVAPEPRRVVVAAIQAQPRHRPPGAAGPVGQQRRFP